MGPDLDSIFAQIIMPDLPTMFAQQRKRYNCFILGLLCVTNISAGFSKELVVPAGILPLKASSTERDHKNSMFSFNDLCIGIYLKL